MRARALFFLFDDPSLNQRSDSLWSFSSPDLGPKVHPNWNFAVNPARVTRFFFNAWARSLFSPTPPLTNVPIRCDFFSSPNLGPKVHLNWNFAMDPAQVTFFFATYSARNMRRTYLFQQKVDYPPNSAHGVQFTAIKNRASVKTFIESREGREWSRIQKGLKYDLVNTNGFWSWRWVSQNRVEVLCK